MPDDEPMVGPTSRNSSRKFNVGSRPHILPPIVGTKRSCESAGRFGAGTTAAGSLNSNRRNLVFRIGMNC